MLFPCENIAYLAALFGQSAIDDMKVPTQYTSGRLKVLASDLTGLRRTIDGTTPLPQHHAHTGILLNNETMEWLTHLTLQQIAALLHYDSTAEKRNLTKSTALNEPIYKCTECKAAFDDNAKLQTHRFAAHKIRHPLRKLVTTPTCPLCMITYKNLRTCQEHISKVCGPRATAQTIRQLTLQVDTEAQL